MPTDQKTETVFSKELENFIAEWKEKPGNLIMILHKVQSEFGYISRNAAMKVAEMLDIPLAKIYGVITFYHFFKLNKPGKNVIQVCMGTACYLKGGQAILDETAKHLNIPVKGVTDDGLFSLESVRCVGCCGLAPVVVIGDEVFGKVLPEQMPEILANFSE